MTPYYDREGITLYHGDCREVLPTLEAGSVDLVLTDPPYGARRPSARRSVGDRFQEIEGNDTVQTEWLSHAVLTIRDAGAMYVFVCWDTLEWWRQGILSEGLAVRSCIVWDKILHGLADLETCWAPQHEMILFAANGRHQLRSPRPKDVLRVMRTQPSSLLHPYEKPVSLITSLIRASAAPGTLILDPFCGSGTTLRAAKDAGCRAIGIEIEERYCEITARRLDQGVFAFQEEMP